MSNFMQIPVITNEGLQTVSYYLSCLSNVKRHIDVFSNIWSAKIVQQRTGIFLNFSCHFFVLLPVKYKSKSCFLFNVTCNQKGHKHQPTRSMTKPQINVFFCCCYFCWYDQISTSVFTLWKALQVLFHPSDSTCGAFFSSIFFLMVSVFPSDLFLLLFWSYTTEYTE